MCLILLAWRSQGVELAVAANRDEFHARPAAAAGFWPEEPAILAGRDMQAKGTWMGVSRSGRFAAVTNYRGAREPSAAESRGALVRGFLASQDKPADFLGALYPRASSYSGFNLLACNGGELWWMSNRDGAPRRLEPGIYGLGNLLLDSAELEPVKARFRATLEAAPGIEPLFGVLAPARIVDRHYGTRCSTVALFDAGRRVRYAERSFAPDGAEGETLRFEFNLP